MKLVVIGGGSSYTPELIDTILSHPEIPVSEVALFDLEASWSRLEIVASLAQRMAARAERKIAINATFDRRRAVEGSAFVIGQFRVGMMDARVRDERLPVKHGLIGQETTGAGGFFAALRNIPVALELCRDMEELAPGAWLLNFSNPAGLITLAVTRNSKVRAVGLCNVPVGMKLAVARSLGVAPDRLTLQFFGLNHLSWVSRVWLDGADVTEKVLQAYSGEPGDSRDGKAASSWEADLIAGLGLIPSPYLRYYYFADEVFRRERRIMATSGTRGEAVKDMERRLFASYRDPNLDHLPPELSLRGGTRYSLAAVNFMQAVSGDTGEVMALDTVNGDAMPDLPPDAVVEVSCRVGAGGPSPIPVGRVPAKVRGLLHSVQAYEELAAEAAVTGDHQTAIWALACHPLVASYAVAHQVFYEMLRAHRRYLPAFGRAESAERSAERPTGAGGTDIQKD